jgi:hypothetical protein
MIGKSGAVLWSISPGSCSVDAFETADDDSVHMAGFDDCTGFRTASLGRAPVDF